MIRQLYLSCPIDHENRATHHYSHYSMSVTGRETRLIPSEDSLTTDLYGIAGGWVISCCLARRRGQVPGKIREKGVAIPVTAA